VRMVPVTIIKDDPDGVWVSGLPEVVTIITVGQEMVVDGERVDVTYEDAEATSMSDSRLQSTLPVAESALPTASVMPIAEPGT
jgi:hypothetical protein